MDLDLQETQESTTDAVSEFEVVPRAFSSSFCFFSFSRIIFVRVPLSSDFSDGRNPKNRVLQELAMSKMSDVLCMHKNCLIWYLIINYG
jgi:hypothetical protein